MNLCCPHCGFSKEVAETAIPANTRQVRCPGCGRSFPFEKPKPAPEKTDGASALQPPDAPASTTVNCPGCLLRQPPSERCRNCGILLAATEAAHRYAGFWLRVVASLIDSMVVFLLQLVSGLMLGFSGSLLGGVGRSEGAVALLIWLFSSILSIAYYVIFTGSCGQTLGKMALRIKVTAVDGSELGYSKAALREIIGKFLSGILLGIGYLMVAFDERKQGLHDKIAGSCVIKL